MRNVSLITKMALAVSGLFILFFLGFASLTLLYLEGEFKKNIAVQQYPMAVSPANGIDGKLAIAHRSQVRYNFIMMALAGASAALLPVWLLMKRMTSQLTSITQQVAAFPESEGERKRIEVDAGDEIGVLAHTFNTMLGVLERKRRALEENEANFRALADNANDGIQIVTKEGACFYANRRFAEITGYSVAELNEMNVMALAHPDDRQRVTERILKIIAGEEVPRHNEMRFIRKDGSIVPVEVASAKTMWHEEPADLVLIRDITERKIMEEELRQSEERFRQLFDQNDDAIILLNPPTGDVIDANPAAERLYGYTKEELAGQGLFFLESAGGHGFSAHDPGPENMGRFEFEKITGIRKDGAKLLVSMRGHAIRLLGKDVIYCSFRDMTRKAQLEREARQTQAKLIEANKMAALGVLVSGVAHEINNPNNFIMANASLLSAAWKDATEILQEYADQNGDYYLGGVPFSVAREDLPALMSGITCGARRIDAIVTNLRDFVRQDGIRFADRVDVGNAVRIACFIIEHEIKKYTDNFTLEIGSELPCVRGNAQQIEQVVINLVMNALNAMQTKNTGLLVSVSRSANYEYVEIKVQDEGVGIPEAVMEQITEPFFTTRSDSGGTGLGLFITQAIVRDHRGIMKFESEPGKGTTVTVMLPLPAKDL